VKAQGIEHVAMQFRGDLPMAPGEIRRIPLQLMNHESSSIDGVLSIRAPDGWRVWEAQLPTRLRRRSTWSPVVEVKAPAEFGSDLELAAVFTGENLKIETIIKIHPLPAARVSHVKTAPAQDGSDRGWEKVPVITISPTNLVQGKVADEADSSATFRLAHDGRVLFVDVQVKDDAVITNIAPNDIKGHWRSDSVEICLDPIGGWEHTMICYKLGVFPFDTTGVVRAARDADANQGPVEETAPKTRLVSRRTADGYRIQAAIPFEEINLPRGRKRFGFNLIIYDGDKRDAALGENINKSRIAWASRSGVQGRPEDWGRIDLE
jgi:hypothetical protein